MQDNRELSTADKDAEGMPSGDTKNKLPDYALPCAAKLGVDLDAPYRWYGWNFPARYTKHGNRNVSVKEPNEIFFLFCRLMDGTEAVVFSSRVRVTAYNPVNAAYGYPIVWFQVDDEDGGMLYRVEAKYEGGCPLHTDFEFCQFVTLSGRSPSEFFSNVEKAKARANLTGYRFLYC